LFRRSESERAVTGIVFLYSTLRDKEIIVSRLKWYALKILLSVSAHVPALVFIYIVARFSLYINDVSKPGRDETEGGGLLQFLRTFRAGTT
jgi:hypothetical protein